MSLMELTSADAAQTNGTHFVGGGACRLRFNRDSKCPTVLSPEAESSKLRFLNFGVRKVWGCLINGSEL